MDRIHYAGNSVLTGTEIARALLDYAQALAEVGSSATVDIPVVGAEGAIDRAELLIGPASQLISTHESGDDAAIADDILAAGLRRKADVLRRHGATSPTADIDSGHVTEGWSEFDNL